MRSTVSHYDNTITGLSRRVEHTFDHIGFHSEKFSTKHDLGLIVKPYPLRTVDRPDARREGESLNLGHCPQNVFGLPDNNDVSDSATPQSEVLTDSGTLPRRCIFLRMSVE